EIGRAEVRIPHAEGFHRAVRVRGLRFVNGKTCIRLPRLRKTGSEAERIEYAPNRTSARIRLICAVRAELSVTRVIARNHHQLVLMSRGRGVADTHLFRRERRHSEKNCSDEK